MPPRRYSRHTFTEGIEDANDDRRVLLSDRKRFLFEQRSDNIHHLVQQGDTLDSIASRYYSGLPRSAGLWWVVADFQPTPIHDPTLRLEPGTTIVVPSLRTVVEDVFNESRREE